MNSKKIGGGLGFPHLSLGRKGLLTGLSLLALRVSCVAQSAEEVAGEGGAVSAREVIDQLLAFIYSLGHVIGQAIVKAVDMVLPSIPIPSELIDPIGILAILTIFLGVATFSKKLVWIVVIAGWVLILIRLSILIIQHYFF